MYRFMLRPTQARPIEYVRVPLHRPGPAASDAEMKAYYEVANFIAEWNYAWEAGHLRPDMLQRIPDPLRWLPPNPEVNLCLVTDIGQRSGYDIYQPLYHLLPRDVLTKHGLPLLKQGHWPFSVPDVWADHILPSDADQRLAQAFAAHVWSHLTRGSSLNAFSADEPLRLLAHNLDFWLPHIDTVATRRMAAFPRVEIANEKEASLLAEARRDLPAEVEINRPLKGGYVWLGEDEAREATRELVEVADQHGHLRGIIDAIRSHRVEDFSERWSFAREDFERKLYGKRVRRVKISFVELHDTIPVHGRDAEVHEDLLWGDLIAVVDPKERRIVVCLRNGVTRVGDIAKELGYANHSPVSKRLAHIRREAARYLLE